MPKNRKTKHGDQTPIDHLIDSMMSINELIQLPLNQLKTEYLIQKIERKLPPPLVAWLQEFPKAKTYQSNKTKKTTLHYSDKITSVKIYPASNTVIIRAGGKAKSIKSHDPKHLQKIINDNIQKAIDRKNQLIQRVGEEFVKQLPENNWMLTLESPASDDFIRVSNPDNTLESKDLYFYPFGLNKKRQKVILADPELKYYLASAYSYSNNAQDIRFVIDMQAQTMMYSWHSTFDLREGVLHGKPIDTIDLRVMDPIEEDEWSAGLWNKQHRYLALSNKVRMTEQEVQTAGKGIAAMMLR